MSDILLYFLATFALVFILQHKALFLHGKLFVLDLWLECSFCVGFAMGLVTWWISCWIDPKPVWGTTGTHALLWALSCATGSLLLSKHLEDSCG
jgi:hypothetical protein